MSEAALRQGKILADVLVERLRQDELKAAGKFQHTCADDEMTDPERLAVLMEEVGEVAREVVEMIGRVLYRGDPVEKLRAELIQTAAVCVAWVEALDDEFSERIPEP